MEKNRKHPSHLPASSSSSSYTQNDIIGNKVIVEIKERKRKKHTLNGMAIQSGNLQKVSNKKQPIEIIEMSHPQQQQQQQMQIETTMVGTVTPCLRQTPPSGTPIYSFISNIDTWDTKASEASGLMNLLLSRQYSPHFETTWNLLYYLINYSESKDKWKKLFQDFGYTWDSVIPREDFVFKKLCIVIGLFYERLFYLYMADRSVENIVGMNEYHDLASACSQTTQLTYFLNGGKMKRFVYSNRMAQGLMNQFESSRTIKEDAPKFVSFMSALYLCTPICDPPSVGDYMTLYKVSLKH